MALNKVRIQLLDEATGKVIEDVDVITSAESVTFADDETFQQKLDSGKLRGTTGVAGSKGEKGDNAVWHFVNSTGAPSNSLGTLGDWAINTAGQTYEKTGDSAWTARTNIKGPQGTKGEPGIAGVAGATGPKGDPGTPGDNVKYGTNLATAQEVKLFFKKI